MNVLFSMILPGLLGVLTTLVFFMGRDIDENDRGNKND